MKKTLLTIALAACALSASAQGYRFTDIVRNAATPVKDQARTGTCWCFGTVSFLESELLRTGKGEYDLSEMSVVRQKYINQLNDYYLRRGQGSLSPGSLPHTALNAIRVAGILPEEVYNGIGYDSDHHDHGELGRYIGSLAKTAVDAKKRSPEYYEMLESVLDIYLGEKPASFSYYGRTYTAESFWKNLGLNLDDYVEITSFSHKPYYKAIDVEVPDNWEHERMYNLPLDEMMDVMDKALLAGYTISWDGDVSEKGFVHKSGLAINPTEKAMEEALTFKKPCEEIKVDQAVRQAGYENFTTTDDHIMHVTGMVKDQNGTIYYITKNSWGPDSNSTGGYLNMSESFVRAKTICFMVHKNAIPKEIRAKLGL